MAKRGHFLLGLDMMDIEPLVALLWNPMLLEQSPDERYGPHLAHQRAVEGELVHSIENLACGPRHIRNIDRIDLDYQHVVAVGIIDKKLNER